MYAFVQVFAMKPRRASTNVLCSKLSSKSTFRNLTFKVRTCETVSLWSGDDLREGVTAFLETRHPEFTGH
jgi:hypothetical protein